MALYKEITLGNGVTVEYHRIVSVNIITNIAAIIEIASYTRQEKRAQEKRALMAEESKLGHDVFIETNYIDAPYDASMTIDQAYEYLKSLDEYTGARDA